MEAADMEDDDQDDDFHSDDENSYDAGTGEHAYSSTEHRHTKDILGGIECLYQKDYWAHEVGDVDVDVAWPTDNWAFPSLVPEERSYTAPGKLWLENASLSYVVVMNLVNRALQKGLRPYPFCSRHENSHSHYHQFLLTLPDEGLNWAALMILAMGFHDPDKMVVMGMIFSVLSIAGSPSCFAPPPPLIWMHVMSS